jgi:hypothetical protein
MQTDHMEAIGFSNRRGVEALALDGRYLADLLHALSQHDGRSAAEIQAGVIGKHAAVVVIEAATGSATAAVGLVARTNDGAVNVLRLDLHVRSAVDPDVANAVAGTMEWAAGLASGKGRQAKVQISAAELFPCPAGYTATRVDGRRLMTNTIHQPTLN